MSIESGYWVPKSDPPKTPMFSSEAQLVALHTAAVGNDGGSPKSRPTMTRSGSSGFSGESGEPGKPGEPV